MPHLLRHRHTYTLLSLSLIDNLTVSNLNIYQDVIKAAKSIVWTKNIIGLFNPFDLLLMSQFYLELKMGHKNSMNILTHFMSVNQISYIYLGILYFLGFFFLDHRIEPWMTLRLYTRNFFISRPFPIYQPVSSGS